MKKLVLLLLAAVLFATTAQSQITIKGVTLGEQLDTSIVKNGMSYKTTLAGISGEFNIYTLKDGRIYLMIFTPTSEGGRVYNTDVNTIVNGISTKYGVSLDKRELDNYSEKYYYKGFVKGVDITILTDSNKYMSPPTELTIGFTNVELGKLAENESQQEANNDF